MSNPELIIVLLFVLLAFVFLVPMVYLLATTISDLRYTSKKLKQIQEERDELWTQYTRNCKK